MVLRADGWVPSTCRIDIPYWSIDTVVTCSQLNKVTFTLKFAPRVYKLEDGLEGLMSGLASVRRAAVETRGSTALAFLRLTNPMSLWWEVASFTRSLLPIRPTSPSLIILYARILECLLH